MNNCEIIHIDFKLKKKIAPPEEARYSYFWKCISCKEKYEYTDRSAANVPFVQLTDKLNLCKFCCVDIATLAKESQW